MPQNTFSEVVTILTPFGRDADIAVAILADAGMQAEKCEDLAMLTQRIARGAGAALVTDDALRSADLTDLSHWLERQPSWSDLPFILLSGREGGALRVAESIRLTDLLGNLTYLERPFLPTTLVSAVRAALRSRRRQYETRAHLAAIRDAAERLDEEKNRLQAVLNNVPVGILFAEISGRILSANPQVERILRHPVLPTGTVEEHGHWIAYHPDGRRVEGREFPLPRAMASGRPVEAEDYLYQRGDGSTAWVQLSAAPIRDSAGEVVAGVVSLVDIDRQKRTEEDLRQSEAAVRENASLLDAIANSIDPIVWAADAEGQIVFTSTRFTEFTGKPSVDLGVSGWGSLVHSDDRYDVFQQWRDAVDAGEPFLSEFRLKHRSGACALGAGARLAAAGRGRSHHQMVRDLYRYPGHGGSPRGSGALTRRTGTRGGRAHRAADGDRDAIPYAVRAFAVHGAAGPRRSGRCHRLRGREQRDRAFPRMHAWGDDRPRHA